MVPMFPKGFDKDKWYMTKDAVQRDVGEGCLRAPPGRSIDAEDEGFDALLDGIIAHVITLGRGMYRRTRTPVRLPTHSA